MRPRLRGAGAGGANADTIAGSPIHRVITNSAHVQHGTRALQTEYRAYAVTTSGVADTTTRRHQARAGTGVGPMPAPVPPARTART